MINDLLATHGFPPAHYVEGREAIANLFQGNKRCGIYVLHFADGRYYVGQSVDVTRRYIEHRRNHRDIVRLSFKPIPQPNLTVVERETMLFLKGQNLELRNIQGIDPLPGLADFDLIMDQVSQERWLADMSLVDLSGSRLVNPELRSAYHGRYLRFTEKPHASDVLEVLQEYVAAGIPRAQAAEESFWSCSCLPASRVYTRININWQEVLSVFTVEEQLCFSFHLALSPFSFGTQVAAYFRHFPNQSRFIELNDVGEIGVSAMALDGDTATDVETDGEELPEEVAEQLRDFFDAFPNTIIQDSRYKPTGEDQFRLIAVGKEVALLLLQDEEVCRAIRELNLRLMRLGPSPYRSSHCLDLADHLVVGA